jgi:hypothetical protein
VVALHAPASQRRGHNLQTCLASECSGCESALWDMLPPKLKLKILHITRHGGHYVGACDSPSTTLRSCTLHSIMRRRATGLLSLSGGVAGDRQARAGVRRGALVMGAHRPQPSVQNRSLRLVPQLTPLKCTAEMPHMQQHIMHAQFPCVWLKQPSLSNTHTHANHDVSTARARSETMHS